MIFKNNNFNKNNKRKGIALLFSVILSSVLFTVATGIIKISLEEIKFNPLAKDASEAFYAADVGAECALFNDVPGGPFPKIDETAEPPPLNCWFLNNNNLPFNQDPPQTWTFSILELGSSQQSCATVTFRRDYSEDGNPNTLDSTEIISRGYAFDKNGDCTSSEENRAERVIRLVYRPD